MRARNSSPLQDWSRLASKFPFPALICVWTHRLGGDWDMGRGWPGFTSPAQSPRVARSQWVGEPRGVFYGFQPSCDGRLVLCTTARSLKDLSAPLGEAGSGPMGAAGELGVHQQTQRASRVGSDREEVATSLKYCRSV